MSCVLDSNELKAFQRKTQNRFCASASVTGFFPFPQQPDHEGQPDCHVGLNLYIRCNDNFYYHMSDGFLLPLLIAKEKVFGLMEEPDQVLSEPDHYYICPVLSDDFRLYHDLMRKAFELNPFAYTNMFQRRFVDWDAFNLLRECTEWHCEKNRAFISDYAATSDRAHYYRGSFFQRFVYENDNDRDFFQALDENIKTRSFPSFNSIHSMVWRIVEREFLCYSEDWHKIVHKRSLSKRPAKWADLCFGFTFKE